TRRPPTALRRRADERPFDGDRSHARQDACRETDRIAADCTKGVAWCDELSLRQAKRACSAFGRWAISGHDPRSQRRTSTGAAQPADRHDRGRPLPQLAAHPAAARGPWQVRRIGRAAAGARCAVAPLWAAATRALAEAGRARSGASTATGPADAVKGRWRSVVNLRRGVVRLGIGLAVLWFVFWTCAYVMR